MAEALAVLLTQLQSKSVKAAQTRMHLKDNPMAVEFCAQMIGLLMKINDKTDIARTTRASHLQFSFFLF